MNDILKNYSQEDIEELAIKELENENNQTTFKIVKIDKEYKKHNKQAITRAIFNGTIILLCAGIVLGSDSNLSNFGTEDLSNIFNNMTEIASTLSKSDILVAVYTKMFDGINYIIDKIGLMGVILASKSIKFVLSSVRDVKKSLVIKKELNELKNKLENKEKHIK